MKFFSRLVGMLIVSATVVAAMTTTSFATTISFAEGVSYSVDFVANESAKYLGISTALDEQTLADLMELGLTVNDSAQVYDFLGRPAFYHIGSLQIVKPDSLGSTAYIYSVDSNGAITPFNDFTFDAKTNIITIKTRLLSKYILTSKELTMLK